jgi:MYXO-CTERM domain-containing protein
MVGGLRLTRLRTTLPASALDRDLVLGAGDQRLLFPTFTASRFSDPSFDPCARASLQPTSSGGCNCATDGSVSPRALPLAGAALALGLVLARRRRR